MKRLIFSAVPLYLLTAMSTAQESSTTVDVLGQVITLAQEQDTFAAAAHVESQGDPLQVAQAYANLVQDLYYKKKNVPLMLQLGTAGVHYCLREAVRCAVADPELASKLRGTAKMMSYNLAVNCWSAWEEEGIVLTPSEIASGYDLARLNLRLAKELKRPADKVAAAWWLLGAHQLSAQETKQAIESFEKAAALSDEAQQPDGHWMAKGYAAIAKRMINKNASEGRAELDNAIAELRKLDTEDSRFYAGQLESIDKYFTK